MGKVVPGTYRVVRPAVPVWCWRNVGDHHESGLLAAWRQEVAGDRRIYWYGLVVTVEAWPEVVTTTARWYWDAYMLPVPNTNEDHHAAWLRWQKLRDARAKAAS